MTEPIPPTSILTVILLAGAIAASWAQPLRIGKATIAPWAALFLASLCSAIAAGIVQPAALPALGAAIAFAHAWRAADSTGPRAIFGTLLLATAFALGTHKLPGFNNPIIINAIALSPDAPPFTLYANFDKGAAGLILLAMVCRKSTNEEWGITLRRALPIAAATAIAVLGSAAAIGYAHLDLKFTEATVAFIALNLLFTVVAEEALFRGFIQQQLANMAGTGKAAAAFSIVVSAALFGAAHLGGGPAFAILAAIAGLGYAAAYQATGRIEAPILVHCAVNAIHVTCFTYPHLN